MNYEKELDKNNVGLKTTLKKIFKDIDKRLNGESEETTSENESTDEETSTKNTLTINNTPYTLAISNRDGSTVYFTLTDENQTTHTLTELGFSQNDSVACNNSNTNETIRGSLKVNDETVTSWGFNDMCNYGAFSITSLPDNTNPYEVGNSIELILTLTDENNDIISTATTFYIVQ